MTPVALGEVVECLDRMRIPVKESERVAGPVPYFGANGQQGWINRPIFDEPLVIVAEDGGHFSEPHRGVAYRIDGPSWVNNHGHVLRSTSRVDHDYLFHALRNFNFAPYISGSTRSKLTQKQLMQAEIRLPPLPEQRRIASILDQADALRAKRREILTHLESLTQSIFRQMFGDALVASERWPTEALGDRLEFLTSGSRGWAKYYSASGAKFLRIQNVRRDELSLDDLAFVNAPDSAEARRTMVRPGDVLLSITADLGRTAVVPDSIGVAHINQHLSILRAPSIEPRYLSAFISSPTGQRRVSARNRAAVKAGLNFDDVRSLRIPLPPRPLQEVFARRSHAVDRQRTVIECAMAFDHEFSASLQSRAFRGEL